MDKSSDAFWSCLPSGLDELFDLVRYEKTDKSYDFWLDEKREMSEEDKRRDDIVAKGYTDYVTVQDYPLRGRPVFLHMRKCRWLDKATGTTFTYELDLPNEPGTRLSAEFVDFLKDENRDHGPEY